MKIVYALIKILILLAFVLLAVSNTQSTAFHYLPGQEISLPLIVLLLGFFVVGAIFGVLAMLGRLLALRNEVNRLRREIRKNGRGAELAATPPATTMAIPDQKG
jgi:putative membrane protein